MSRRGGGRRGHGLTGFEEGGGYMAVKIAKLQNQYKESVDTEEGEAKKGLFNGVAIFVNGYTEPTAEELKRVMMVHGGTYHHYYSRTNTTHIIANNLPDSKVKNMNTERIVSPKWITDSLAAGHLLDYTKYILYTRQSKDQPRLQFKPAPPPDTGQDSSKSVEGESSRESEQKSETCQDVSCISPVNEDLFAQQINAAASDSHRDAEADTDAEGDFERHVVNSTNSPSTSTSTTTIQNNSPVKGRAMSTANPKFLSEFYNNSRLHHISTMGAMFKEYVNELQNKCDGFPGREKLKNWIMNKDMSKSGTHIREGSPHLSSSFQGKNKRVIMHIDMDCFFVSVGLRKHPHLCEKAVAVTHARGNSQGQVREGMDRQYELNFYKQRAEKKLKARMLATGSTKVTDRDLIKQQEIDAEISEQTDDRRERKLSTINLIDETSSMSEIASCNYEARKAGVRNGMFLGPALKLCPNLKTIPYDFEGYKEVSYKLYDIVASFTHDIEAVSCDEMFVDLTDILQSCNVSPEDFTTYLRERVYTETGCPCSAGLGPNMLVARMATRHAKPNGQHWADPGDLPLYMQDHKATELPGVGWSTGKRLEAEGLITCGDLQRCALSQLQTLLGPRTGHSLYNYCRGLDTRAVKSEHVRKSVSAEVNYGIRFTCLNDAHKFIGELATEVEGRLAAIKMKGRCITVKLKVRAKDAPVETAKFMGHGVCDNIAKSVSLSSATSSAAVIERETLGLLKLIKTPPQDFRGVGIQVSRLETACASKSAGTSIRSFLLGAKRKAPDIEASLAGGLATDVSTCASETTLAENRNPEVAAKESQECKLSNQRSDAGHSAGTSHLPSGNPEPTTSNNTSSSEAKSIDMEVLLALPEDMRDQVIAEYRQQGYIIPTLPSGRGNAATIPGMSEPQPGTSGYVAPKAEKRQVTHSINQPQSAIDGVEGSKKAASSEVKESEGNGNNAMANVPNTSEDAAAVRQPCGVQDVAETSNSNSNFSTAAENAQNSELVTSFSQVDSSFLEALPEELRQELKQDLERLKQREGAAAVPGNLGLRGSPVKQKNLHTRGRGRPRGSTGRRGRGSKADSRRVEAEGLVTLTSMMLGNTGQPGNFKIKKNIPGGKKRDRSPSSKVPGTDLSSPNKRERLPRVNGSPEPPAAATDELPTTEQVTGKKVEAEILPDLCGMKELADVKSLMQAWVASCAHPENEDADILGSYFTSLIMFRDLEKLDCLIKYLYRQILRTQNKLWESAYQVVINQVQSAMVEAYGTKLKVTVFDRS